MILLFAILFISFEAIGEAILKRFKPSSIIFNGIVQWVIAIVLFGLWFVLAYNSDKYYVPVWKLTCGFIFVRFALFDLIYNLTAGLPWDYYGKTKLYDRIMYYFGGFGWFVKIFMAVPVGVAFLLGWA